MISKLTIIAACIIAVVLLAGCGDSDNMAAGANSFDVSQLSDVNNPVNEDGADDGNGDSDPGPINPEPMTMLLLGGGLAAYAFLKR